MLFVYNEVSPLNKYLFFIYILIFIGKFSECQVIRGNERPGQQCNFPDEVVGRCEEVRRCVADNGVLNRNSIIKLCQPSRGQVYVCCRKPFVVASEICRAWKNYWTIDSKCVYETPLIVGGINAGVGQFPHIAQIRDRKSEFWECGGTLLSPHFVITAAHCVNGLGREYVVKLGEHDVNHKETQSLVRVVGPVPLGLFKEREIQYEPRNQAPVTQIFRVINVFIHPDYDVNLRGYNDIALVQLDRPAVMTRRVLPACLPTNPREDFNNKDVTVAGWGQLKFGYPIPPSTLQKVKIPVVDRLRCWKTLSNISSDIIPKGITEEQICAGAQNKDTCTGDSGGPMVLQVFPSLCEHTLVGITSVGPGCGRIGIYTRVSSFVEWITGYIAPKILPRNT